jgi:hypothetical protein
MNCSTGIEKGFIRPDTLVMLWTGLHNKLITMIFNHSKYRQEYCENIDFCHFIFALT